MANNDAALAERSASSSASTAPEAEPVPGDRAGAGRFRRVWIRDKFALAGLVIAATAIFASAFAFWFAPYDPYVGDGSLRLSPPGTEGHPLGLDGQGRDILSRLIWGGRMSLTAALLPIAGAFFVSAAIGLFAGYLRGKIGETLMRAIDVLFAFPTILIAMGIATVLEAGLRSVIVTIFVALIPPMSRVVYTAVLAESGKEYIEAARVLGASKAAILFKELLPNVVTPLLVYATSLVGKMIIFSAGLSFMGLGIQAPQSDWGKMTSDGMAVLMQGAPHVATLPGLVILIVSIGFNWVGDGLRNYFDPRYK
ncbi:ABC transporter permease [Cohnella massiliensis]|uniref:ABC transporter permease n=1 Tax=Cohnella massiliensis TaxID=1816691 RepID=UPI0009BC50C1|nr:ABC transporter permease [Cohnella massiliensis]